VRLVAADLRLLEAALAGDAALSEALGAHAGLGSSPNEPPRPVEVAPGWNSFPEALRHVRDSVAANPASVEWGTRLFVDDAADPPVMVGWGGFKGAPSPEGEVELGYEIAEGLRGRGLATAAVEAMLDVAAAAPGVRSVIAHTLAERNASVRVLEKTGFELDTEIEDPDDGPVWRHRKRLGV
jgi:RimJ/RimL family protein N-acetyltransferase